MNPSLINIKIEGVNYKTAIKKYQTSTSSTNLVFFQGLADTYLNYNTLLTQLAKNHTIYTLDLPGFGTSQKPIHFEYTMRNIAEIVRQFLTKLEINNAHLLGVSLGANIALLTFRYFQKQYDFPSLVMITPILSKKIHIQLRFLSLPVGYYILKLLTSHHFARLDQVQNMYFDLVLNDMDHVDTDLRRKYKIMFGNNDVAEAYHSILQNFVNIKGVTPQIYELAWKILTEIQNLDKTYVIIGKYDKIPDNNEIVNLLYNNPNFKNDNLTILHSGHAVHVEKPNKLLKCLSSIYGRQKFE